MHIRNVTTVNPVIKLIDLHTGEVAQPHGNRPLEEQVESAKEVLEVWVTHVHDDAKTLTDLFGVIGFDIDTGSIPGGYKEATATARNIRRILTAHIRKIFKEEV